MPGLRCAFSNFNNLCHYKYKGYRCIFEDCDVYGKFMVREKECIYLQGERCSKLNILGCLGKDKCIYFKEFITDPKQWPYLNSEKDKA